MKNSKADIITKPYVVPEAFRNHETTLDEWDYYIHAMDRVQRLASKGLIPIERLESMRSELYLVLCKPSIIEERQKSNEELQRRVQELEKVNTSLEDKLDRFQQSTCVNDSSLPLASGWSRFAKWIIIGLLVFACWRAYRSFRDAQRMALGVPEIERNLAGSLMRLNIQQRRSQPCS
jgi:hypothetical protein